MKKLSFVRVVYVTMLITAFVSGQSYEITRYADDSGLPSRIVRGVQQDKLGFLWVAGNNGLYKFDGKKFNSYYSALKDSTGLRDNRINTVLTASNGKVWIATPKGLHVLHKNTISYVELLQNPTESQNYIKTLVEDANQNIWIGTYSGLFVIGKENTEVHYVSHPDIGSIPEDNIHSLSLDRKNRVWVSTDKNVYMSSDENKYAFNKLTINLTDDLDQKNTSLFRFIDYSDNLLLIDSSKGLLKGQWMDDTTIQVDIFKDERQQPVSNEFIYHSIIDSDQNIWTATWKNRFKKYSINNGQLVEESVILKNGLNGMSVWARSIYQDAQDNIWISNSNGLYRLSEYKGAITTFPQTFDSNCLNQELSIYAITEDNGGHLWITTPNDLFRFNKSDVLKGICPTDYIHITNEQMRLSRNIFIDSQNRLWIGAENGLYVAQLDSNYHPGKFMRYTKSDGLPHNWSFDIYEEEEENTFWIGNYAGLVKMTLNNNSLFNPSFKVYDSSKKRSNALVNSYTSDIEVDKNGNKWFGTFHGLSRLISDKEEGVFANYVNSYGNYSSISNNSIKKVFCDKSGRLWVATQKGLNLYDITKDNFIQFGRTEGLPSEYILGIQEDSKGYLWIATTNGVIKTIFDEHRNVFTNIKHITTKDGLIDNITYRNAIHIDQDDNVFIGSAKGLSIVTGTKPTAKKVNFNLTLTAFQRTKNKEQGFSPISNWTELKEVKLSHNENSVKINYAVLDLTNPSLNTYRHKFLPVSDNWIETGNNSELTYYNLSPDNYEIILDGSNVQDSWSGQPIHLKFTITPPFWKSNIAIILYALVLGAILRVSYLFRIKKRLKELEREAEFEKAIIKEREQLRQENTADFHDELGSKVTKISLFLTLAERHLKDNKDPSEWFLKIRDNIKDLSGGFRDLLWVIDPKKDNLNDTFLRLKDFGEELFNHSDATFVTKGFNEDLMNITLDPQTKKQIVMIFKEAMNNCAKYSECKHVEFTINSTNEYSCLQLKDDGKGFDVKKKSKGRGLKNMMNRSQKIKADLTVVADANGTSIHLDRIPHMSDSFNAKVM